MAASMHPRASIPKRVRSLLVQQHVREIPWSLAMPAAASENASSSAAVGALNSPLAATSEIFPYMSRKLNMHRSVQAEASPHSISNFRRWYARSIPLPISTGSYLQTILSRPILSDILAQASLMSALNGTPGSMDLP